MSSGHGAGIAELPWHRTVYGDPVDSTCEVRYDSALCAPEALMAYLGLAPLKPFSGYRTRNGSIAKAGSTHARKALISAAWKYTHYLQRSQALQRRQHHCTLAPGTERTHGWYAQATAAFRSAFEKAGLATHVFWAGIWRAIGRLRQQNVPYTRFAAACAAALALALVTVLAGCTYEPVELEVEGFPFAITPQEVESRIWKDVQPEVVAILGSAAGLHRPMYLFEDQHGDLFVTDYGDFRVKKFDADGSLVQVYGRGRGTALGEFGSPQYASVDPEGNVWVPDLSLQKLVIFEDAGTMLRTIPLDYRPYGLRHLSDGRYFIYIVQGSKGPQPGMFGLYRDAELLTQFGATELDPTTAAGEIVAIDGDLVYSPGKFEFIVRYDESGNVVYARETLQQEQKSVLEDMAAAMYGIPPMLKSSLGHQGGRIYIDAWVLSEKRDTVIIDVYRAADGSYEFSFELPEERFGGIDIGRNAIYTTTDTTVVIYRLPL